MRAALDLTNKDFVMIVDVINLKAGAKSSNPGRDTELLLVNKWSARLLATLIKFNFHSAGMIIFYSK